MKLEQTITGETCVFLVRARNSKCPTERELKCLNNCYLVSEGYCEEFRAIKTYEEPVKFGKNALWK